MIRTVEGYTHRTGEHCASTALRNVVGFHGLELTEAAVFGLGAGLGFVYIRNDAASPSRLFYGRTLTFENDFCRIAAIPVRSGRTADDEAARTQLEQQIDQGTPMMLLTDTFYLGYQNTKTHFPGHRAVAIGYDTDDGGVVLADRKFEAPQRASAEEIRGARNATDHPESCGNEFHYFEGPVAFGRPYEEVVELALRKTAANMLEGVDTPGQPVATGIAGLRRLAAELPEWTQLQDWSWSSRFAYQMIIKRGAAGTGFRQLTADFFAEVEARNPAFARGRFAERMRESATGWVELAGIFREQSERETCSATLFAEASRLTADLATREESIFRDLAAPVAPLT